MWSKNSFKRWVRDLATNGPRAARPACIRAEELEDRVTPATYIQSFDAFAAPTLPTGWSTANLAGANPWVSSSAASVSAPNAAFAAEPAGVTDSVLVSPALAISDTSVVTFRNSYNTEANFDGGVLEVSVNGGAYADILVAGGSFIIGGYNAAINPTSTSSPIPGQPAWTGDSDGFTLTGAFLPASAVDQTVRLRWRMTTDASVAGAGWRVDDIAVSNASTPLNFSAPVPDFTIRLSGSNTEFRNTNTGALLASQDTASTSSVNITGTAGADRMTIDFAAGNPLAGAFGISGVEGFILSATVGNDTLSVSGQGSGRIGFAVNASAFTGFVGVTSVAFVGLGGTDALTVDYAAGTIPAAVAFDSGGQANDSLLVTGGNFASAAYAPTGATAGTVTRAGGSTGNAGAVTFAGLARFTDQTAAAAYTVSATAAADTVSVVNGPVLAAGQSGQVLTAGFPTAVFLNKQSVRVNSLGGADTVTVDGAAAAVGQTSLTVDGGAEADGLVLRSTPAGVPVAVLGGAGDDVVTLGSDGFATGSDLDGIRAAVSVDAGAGTNYLYLVDIAGGANPNVVVTADTVTGFAGPTNAVAVTYAATGGLFGFFGLYLSDAGDTVAVRGTSAAALTTGVLGRGGADFATVGTGGANSSLDAVAGPVLVELGGGADALTVDDRGDATANTYTLSPGQVARPGAAQVAFNGVDAFALFGGTAANTFNVSGSADSSTVVTGGAAPDTFNITASGLTGANTFNGGSEPGSTGDTFTVTSLPAESAGLSISVNGNGPTVDPGDTLSVDGGGATVSVTPTAVVAAGREPVNYANIETLSAVTQGGGAVVVDGTGQDDTLVLTRSGNDLRYVLNGLSVTVTGGAASGSFTFNGGAGSDRVTVDYGNSSGGAPVPPGGVFFNGGESAGDDDRLAVTGFNVALVTVTHTGAESGVVRIGAAGNPITFAETEPLTLFGTMADLVITLPASADPDAVLGNDGTPGADPDGNTANTSAIDGTTFEFTQFTNPTNSLTVNASGGDLVQFGAPDPAFNPATLTFTGASAADTFRPIVNGALPNAAAVVVQAATFDIGTLADTVGSFAGTGVLTFGANGALTTGGNNTPTTFSGTITGPSTANLVKQGAGAFTLSGANAGYGGSFTVGAGTLVSASDGALGNGGGGTTVAAGAGLLFSAAATTFSEPLTLGGGTVSVANGSTARVGNVILGATSTLNPVAAADRLEVAGAVTQAAAGGLVKTGLGLAVLFGNGTYTGATQVTAGTLEVLGTLASPVTVAAGGTLAGTGGTAGVSATGGTVSPGPSAGGLGTLTSSGAFTLAAGSTYAVDLAAPGSGGGLAPSDRLSVAGTVTLGGALALAAPAAAPGFGTVYVLVDNDGTDAVAGTFAGLPEGAVVAVAGTPFRISYAGGTGNDVTLTATPTLTIADVTVTEGTGGTTQLVFTLTLAGPSSQTVAVDYATADGTATTADGDYTAVTGTVLFLPGQTTRTVVVTVAADAKFEPTETLLLNLSNAVNVQITDAQAVGTVTNDDGQPAVSVSDVTASEGSGGVTAFTFTVSLSNPAGGPVTVSYATADGTATAADGDYTAAAGALTFAPGETAKTVTVLVNGDTRFEPTEAFFLNLVGVTGPAGIADAQAVGTITNDDAVPAVSVGDVLAFEGTGGLSGFTFTVTLSNASSQTVTVGYATADGTATVADGDYQAATGTLTFAPGETTKTVTVTVNGDAKFEADQGFALALTGPANATLADAQGLATVRNDDAAPTVSIADVSLAEGNTGTTAFAFTISLSNPSDQAVTVVYATADGSAVAGLDYAASAGAVTLAPGQTTATVAVLVTGDATTEPNETFAVNLAAAMNAAVAGGTATGTILNDDAPPTITVGDAAVDEGDDGTTQLVFTVTLSNASSTPVTVDYSTAGLTAAAGVDFATAAGTLTFAPGGPLTLTVRLTVNGDAAAEPDETLALNLSGAAGGTLGDVQAVGTITNDDDAPTVSVGGPAAAGEGNAGPVARTFTVTLSNPSSSTVTVNYATADGTATAADGDYAAAAGALTFAPGETSKTVTVLTTGDAKFESDEAFALVLSRPAGATLGTATAGATLTNDDAVPTLALTGAAVDEGSVGQRPLTFILTLSNPSDRTVTVNYATADGTATAGTDYVSATGTVTFLPGETTKTVTVLVNGDATFEPDEQFTLVLSDAVDATVGPAPAGRSTGTVRNDDRPPAVAPGDVSVSGVTAAEGNAGPTVFTFTLTLSNPSSTPFTVGYGTVDGSATVADGDYAAATGTVTFAPGATTATVTVLVTGDLKFEADEQFTLALLDAAGAASGASATAFVLGDDGQPRVSVGPATVVEGADGQTAALVFTVTLSGASSQPVQVAYATVDGTAFAGSDYAAAGGTLTFLPGETTKTVTVDVVGDGLSEADEALSLAVTGVSNATVAAGRGTGTIANDDATPTVSVGDATVVEGQAGTRSLVFTFTLSAPAGGPVTVEYATGGGTAAADGDYAAATGTVTFAPGETTRTVAVEVFGDDTLEADETVLLMLAAPAGAGLANEQAVGTIANDDGPRRLAVGSGAGAAPAVVVYDAAAGGPTPLPGRVLTPEFTGGVRTASADVTGDGFLDVVVAGGPGGGPSVLVYDGRTGAVVRNFVAYEASFTGGVFVTAGDVNGDGYADIVTAPDVGGGPRVLVVDGRTGAILADFFGIEDSQFRGGARVGLGDVNGDGTTDLIVGAGVGGGPRVALYDGRSLRAGVSPVKLCADFFVFDEALRGGVYVSGGDVTGDGFDDIVIGSGPGGGPRVLALSGRELVAEGLPVQAANFFAGDEANRDGVRVAAPDLDDDGFAEVVTGDSEGLGATVTVYRGRTVRPDGTPDVFGEFEAFPAGAGVFVG